MILGHGIDMVLETRFARRRDKWSQTILSEKELEIYNTKIYQLVEQSD